MYAPLPSEFVSFQSSRHFRCLRICLILLYILVGVYLSSWCLSLGWRPSPSYRAHVLFFPVSVALLVVDPIIPLHHVYYSITFPFYFMLPMGLRADAPTVPAHFFVNLLLKASLAHFPHLYLFRALLTNILVVLTHFISRTSLTHLLLLYLFYSHGLFARSFELPRLDYHTLISYLLFRLTRL